MEETSLLNFVISDGLMLLATRSVLCVCVCVCVCVCHMCGYVCGCMCVYEWVGVGVCHMWMGVDVCARQRKRGLLPGRAFPSSIKSTNTQTHPYQTPTHTRSFVYDPKSPYSQPASLYFGAGTGYERKQASGLGHCLIL